jgi:hypothetical protein
LLNFSPHRFFRHVRIDVIGLVEELDGLPLALATAGSYLEYVTTSFSDYLRLYKASWLKLQKTSPLLDSYEDRTLYTVQHGKLLSIGSNSKMEHQQNYLSYGHILIDRICGLTSYGMQTL